MAAIGPIERFASPQQLVSYFGLIPTLTEPDSRGFARREAGLIQGWRTGEFRHADPTALGL
jgi:hypothetical protein